MPASSRPAYAAPLAQTLGLSVGALMEEWLHHAAEVPSGWCASSSTGGSLTGAAVWIEAV